MSLFPSFRENSLRTKASQLYGTAMAQARQEAFYACQGVDDTPDGRLAMISLHVLLVLDRLTGDAEAMAQTLTHLPAARRSPPGRTLTPAQMLGRCLMEVFVEDLDQAMREMGIGDMGVPKRVKQAIAQFYAFAQRYKATQSDPNQPLPHLLADFLPGLPDGSENALELARYVVASHRHLQDVAQDSIEAGRVSFPAVNDALA